MSYHQIISKADECLARLDEMNRKVDRVQETSVTSEEIWCWLFGLPIGALVITSVIGYILWR